MCGTRSLASDIAAFQDARAFNGDLSKWYICTVTTNNDMSSSTLILSFHFRDIFIFVFDLDHSLVPFFELFQFRPPQGL